MFEEAAENLSDLHLLITLYVDYYIFESKAKKQPIHNIDQKLLFAVYYELTEAQEHIPERAKKIKITLLPQFKNFENNRLNKNIILSNSFLK